MVSETNKSRKERAEMSNTDLKKRKARSKEEKATKKECEWSI